MTSTKEKELIGLIKKLMKEHGMVSWNIGVIDMWIGNIRVTPKGWERLLVPIKGYHYDDFDLFKVMHLNGELYFMVSEEHKTYDYPRKREIHRYTWDEFVDMVETKKWSRRNRGFGGKNHTEWRTCKLRSIASGLKYYDPQEEAERTKQPKLTEANLNILVKIQEAETSFAEKLVDRVFGY